MFISWVNFKKENENKNILLLVNGCERRCLVKSDFEDCFKLVIDVADFLDIFNENNTAQKLSNKLFQYIENNNI